MSAQDEIEKFTDELNRLHDLNLHPDEIGYVLTKTGQKITSAFTRRWVCFVQRSGFHNGVTCNENDPHDDGWGCGWRWEAMLNDDQVRV